MQWSDIKKFFGGLNTDDNPNQLPEGDYTGGLNIRTLGSSEQHGEGPLETLQSEIEIILGVTADITYYGDVIGGDFIYTGYEEVQIGSQVWMKNNWDADYPGSKAYDDDEDNADVYGRLYTHDQVMATNFCPAGLHIPTEAEVDELLAFLISDQGGKLKNAGTERWLAPNTGATDSSGFKALPGGKFDSAFELLGLNGLFWLQDDGDPTAPVALNGSAPTATTFTANWLALEGVSGYRLDVATDIAFTAFVAGFNNLDVGNVLSYIVTGLVPFTDYFYRVRAYN